MDFRVASSSRGRFLTIFAAAAILLLVYGADLDAQAQSGDVPADTDATPCGRFQEALASDRPVREVVRDFGLPEVVKVGGAVATSTYYCTSVRDESGAGEVLAVLVVDDLGDRGILVPSEAGRADTGFDDQDWIDMLRDHGFDNARRFEHGFIGGSSESRRDSSTADVWAELDRGARP
jgi:hypothetical protein